MNKKTLLLILLAAVLLPTSFVFADTPLVLMANVIANQVWVVGTWLVVIFWVVTGIMFLTAQGEATALTKAKMALFASIGGTIIIILAPSALSFIQKSFGL